MNAIPNFHYITQDISGISHEQLAEKACRAGVPLVQLRLKDIPKATIKKTALAVKQICHHYGALFIVNDYLDIALEVDADGVHLGQSDDDHFKARLALGPEKIIGGTAYSLAEAMAHFQKQVVNYIGVGNFRFTSTNPEIKEMISIAELAHITAISKTLAYQIPIVVIGGIQLTDLPLLKTAGVHGIAVASLINQAKQPEQIITQFHQDWR